MRAAASQCGLHWGKAGLPLPYVLLVTLITKIFLILAASKAGVDLQLNFNPSQLNGPKERLDSAFAVVGVFIFLFIEHLLYQGLLDLHGQLFGSNGGELLGHL